MYQQFNDQFATSTRQFADATAQVGRLALENTEAVFGLHFATIEENMNATFAFFGELANVRDLDGAKAVWPKGVQIARENVERSIGAGQEAFGRTLKTQEAIVEFAKAQFETAAQTVQAEAEKVAKKGAQAATGRKNAR
jgi:hypothetical protein